MIDLIYWPDRNTEQWSVAADWSRDNPPVDTAINTSHRSDNTTATTNDPSHIAGNPNAEPNDTSSDTSESSDHQSDIDRSESAIDSGEGAISEGVMEGLHLDDALLDDEQAFHENFVPANFSPFFSPREPLASDNSTPPPHLSPRNILSTLATLSRPDPDHLSAGPSKPDISEGDTEGSVIIQGSYSMLSTAANLEHVPRTQKRPRKPKAMNLVYEERIPDYLIFSQLKAEDTYSTIEEIPTTLGHPILIIEVKPVGFSDSRRYAESILQDSTTQKQTASQACLCFKEYNVDVLTVMSAAGLYVQFDQYCQKDVAPFLKRSIPDMGAGLSRFAKPSSSSEVMPLFNNDMSDYSPQVMWHWKEILQFA